ncbi:MAG: PDZ domain-containing protein [Desulfobulbaceae bacterium]|nr:PDZ domain-containing protein [Desulfobulbaceae bacterium]
MRNSILLWGIITVWLTGCAVEQPPRPMSVVSNAITPSAPAPLVAAQSAPVAMPLAVAKPVAKPRATGTPEDARRHMIRGMAAIEMAKSEAELMLAEDEFRMATEISPQMANAWFNLGKTQSQLGRFGEAVASYRQYLVVAPGAEDAQRVRDEIVKLEFRQELAAKSQARVGNWVAKDGTLYSLTIDGNRLTLKTDRRLIPENEVRSTYSLVGMVPLNVFVAADYQLIVQGNRLTGTWHRGAVRADKCTVPPDIAAVTGEFRDSAGMMVLNHELTSFLATIQMSLLGEDSCGNVTALQRKTVEEVLYGPLGRGRLGVTLTGLTSWWDGGFSVVQYGWQGRLAVAVSPDSPAYAAGLRDGDEILAIDGVAVKSLSAGEAVVRMFGDPGSRVHLEVWRKGIKDPFIITLLRV